MCSMSIFEDTHYSRSFHTSSWTENVTDESTEFYWISLSDEAA